MELENVDGALAFYGLPKVTPIELLSQVFSPRI